MVLCFNTASAQQQYGTVAMEVSLCVFPISPVFTLFCDNLQPFNAKSSQAISPSPHKINLSICSTVSIEYEKAQK